MSDLLVSAPINPTPAQELVGELLRVAAACDSDVSDIIAQVPDIAGTAEQRTALMAIPSRPAVRAKLQLLLTNELHRRRVAKLQEAAAAFDTDPSSP